MSRFYEAALTPGVREVENMTFFRRESCEHCGRSVYVQIADLVVKVDSDIDELPALMVVPGGHLLMAVPLWGVLDAAGARAFTRGVTVLGDDRGWVQVVPSDQVLLTPGSLRSTAEECSKCGGTVRPRFDGAWTVDSAVPPDAILATVTGAEQIVVISDEAVELLAREGVDVSRRPLFPVKRPVDDDPHGWGDL
jgi:hypothetical protein